MPSTLAVRADEPPTRCNGLGGSGGTRALPRGHQILEEWQVSKHWVSATGYGLQKEEMCVAHLEAAPRLT